ncbi:MAG: IS110 family transposase [Chloroflexota bacterium]
MGKDITWVALDTSKRKHVVAILDPGAREPRGGSLLNEGRAIARLARKLVREAPGEVRVCYEAGPCGFALMRQLEAAAPLTCEVVAPSLIPVRPGERIKTDRRDAAKLVRLFRAGELTTVQPPTEAQEAARDLVRCREDAKEDLMRSRHRLSKFLLRRGVIYTSGSAWTQKHSQWLSTLRWELPGDEETFADYRMAISQLEARIRALDTRIEEIAQQEAYREPVGWLRCFRGIDTITAMTILAEIHDFRRFQNARQFASYLGLVPLGALLGKPDATRRYHPGWQPPCAQDPGRGGTALTSSSGSRPQAAPASGRATGVGDRSRRPRHATAVAPPPAAAAGARQAPQQGGGCPGA